jgi:type IV pilus assembly protein PilY1
MHPVNRPSVSRSRRRNLLSRLAGAGLVLGFSGRATAQSEAETPPPNVLLLVDSSGSMEFKTDGTFPTCTPGDETVQQKSRWIDLVEVLTGRFQHYSCWSQDRSSTAFKNEFSLSGVAPYDFGYVNPYHRALSSKCLVGPGVLPSPNAFSWPTNAVNTFALLTGNVVDRPASAAALAVQPACAGFAQFEDGLLDVYKNDIRFGLMTFDARVSAGTGYSGTTPNYTTGTDGNWSYFLGTAASGHPANCSFEVDQEVGARNAAAPPWEGRMVAFGPPNLADNTERNSWIQQTLMATRPYGATPLNGQLYDARDFLRNDASTDPLDATAAFGPKDDPNWKADDCRKTIMIVLSDGEPNLDLRPYCEATPPPPETAGRCPYPDPPEKVVRDLRLAPPRPNQAVETYVIGFALGTVKPFGLASGVSCDLVSDAQCADPKNNDFTAYPEGKAVQACCTLNKIAAAGGNDTQGQPRKAFFANSSDELRSIFTTILSGVIRAATRTSPVFSPSGDSSSKGFKFAASFETRREDPADPRGLWHGQLDRHRFLCSDDQVAEEQDVKATDGDDFAANMNAHGADRHFYTVIADGNSRNSLRPDLTSDNDGIGLAGGATVVANSPSELVPLVPPGAMALVDNTSCPGFTALVCRNLILKHLVGLTNEDGKSRCFNGDCQLLGGIVHSTPTIVPGKPSELLRDESYDTFGRTMATDKRPTVLYTSTVDGFLHAFNVAPFPGSVGAADREIKDGSNNELWAFIPPAVLPVLRTQYPKTPAVLLDGIPIVKDVVSQDVGSSTRFERVQSDALTGSGKWRTVLLQSFGEGQVNGGYFAVDVTKPDRAADHAPKFLWQLTRDASGLPLFGNGGTPLITTIFLQSGASAAREVAVAVLPGGDLSPGVGTSAALPPALGVSPSSFATSRNTGLNYTGAERARSLTIARLDTGEVIRTFRPIGTGFSAGVYTNVNIPAPLTGQPKAFPENAGAVADRIFVGDRDGRLWRVDVSSKDPADWRMDVFFDAFYDNLPPQPVVLPPSISTDDDGAVTVAFATGDQQVSAAPSTTINRVISLTEKLGTGNVFISKVNWIHSLNGAYRVTGPMQLFNKGLYYAASTPPEANGSTCGRGSAKVFAADYLKSSTANDPSSGPDHADGQTALLIDQRSPGLIFGVSLQADPTCKSEAEVISGDDSYGYGLVSMAKRVNPGRFHLSYQVSGTDRNSSGNSSNGTTTQSTSKGITSVKTVIDTPHAPVTFESWALIYE